MPTKKETEQTSIAPSQEWERMVRDAKDLPELHPKLKFGDTKTSEVRYELEFVESQPRFAEFDDPYNKGEKGRAMFINVRVVDGPDTKNALRSLAMPAKVDHGLTRGVLGIARKHQNDLKGVRVIVETRNYKHKQFGPTRGFNISEVDTSAAP